jgi:Flp pilus assembly secretin CpaC
MPDDFAAASTEHTPMNTRSRTPLITLTASFCWPVLLLPLVAAVAWSASLPPPQEPVRTNQLAVGEAQIISATGSNVVVATEGIIRVLPAGPGKLVVSAVKNGRTDLLVLDDNGKTTERYEMVVAEHAEAKMTYQASLDDFKNIIREIVGEHKIQFDVLVGPRISFSGTNLVSYPKPVLFMHGVAKDEIEADAVRAVASRFYGQADFGSTTTQAQPSGNVVTNTITDLKNDPNIVDQITIAAYHQVRIRIQVAEVNIGAIKQKGIRYSDFVQWGVGRTGPANIGALATKGANAKEIMADTFLTGLIVPQGGNDVAFQATLQLLISDNYARLLSEPTLVVKSGQKADFLAGGKLLQSQPGGAVGGPQGASNYRTEEFGVRMRMTPLVDRAKHIDLNIFTEVSDIPAILDANNLTISTRNSTTALRMNSGDTLVLSGLIQNNMRNAIRKIPWLGQIPVLGSVFRSKDWNAGQSELLFFVTPEIIGDFVTDTARNINTPAMKQWINVDAHKDVLPDPNSHASKDNDVHDLLGLPPDKGHSNEPMPRYAPAPAPPPPAAPAGNPPGPARKPERKYY